MLKQGDLIGEMSFMSSQPASADVFTTGEATIAYWSHKDLEKIKNKNNPLYNKFISIIGRNLVKKLDRKNHEIVNNEAIAY
jgi:CRP-like cAMP-binding protein